MTQLSFRSKLTYGLGSIPYAAKDAAFGMFVLLYYKQVLGLSGSLTGLAIFISVLWDAVSDPMVGAWSDRLRTRWGRRHPMMAAGLLPLGLSFVMLFHPVEAVLDRQLLLFAWLLVSVIMLRTFLTLFIIPYTAMGAEISDDYYERTSIVSFRTNLGWIAGVILPAAALPLLFGVADVADPTLASGEDGRFVSANYHVYGWMSCALVVFSGTIAIIGTRQFIPHLQEVAARNRTTPGMMGLLRDARDTLANVNFRRLIVLDIAVGATQGILGAMHMITMTYFWELSALQIAALAMCSLLAAIMVFPGMGRLAARWQKHVLLKWALAGMVLNTAWLVPGRLLGWVPENGTTLLLVLLFAHGLAGTILIIVRTITNHSIMADIADEHELSTGRRQEGVFFAAAAFASKFVMGFGYMIAGPLLDLVGLEAGVQPGDAPASALLGIGLVVGPLMMLLYIVPWWMATRLDLSRSRLAEIHASLGRNNSPGAVSVAAPPNEQQEKLQAD